MRPTAFLICGSVGNGLREFVHALRAELLVQRAGGLQSVIDVVDVLDAGRLKPLAEGIRALLGEDWDAVFPCGASAEDAVELRAGLSGEFESLDEDRGRNTGREIDERLMG